MNLDGSQEHQGGKVTFIFTFILFNVCFGTLGVLLWGGA